MAAQAAPPSGSVSPAPQAPLTRASLSCHLSRGTSREFHRGEFGCFPAPHPGPGTQEVLSEHEQWGTGERPASLFSGPSFGHPWNSSSPSSGTRSYTPSPLGSACRGHAWPPCGPDTVTVCPASPGAQARSQSDGGCPSPGPSWSPWVTPLATLGGGQLQEVPMPLSSLLPLTFVPLLYPHGAHLLWTPLGPRDALPALYLTCLRKSVIIMSLVLFFISNSKNW